jgi:imidazolonepropionase-like amidohydrolase
MSIRQIACSVLNGFLLSLWVVATHANTLIITNATLIDGTGSIPVTGVSIVLKNGYVDSIATGELAVDDALVIDARGKVVMPGLIDMHTHPLFEIRSENPKMPFPDPDSLPSSDVQMREFIETRLPTRLDRFLAGGVTTVISAGGYWPYDIQTRERLDAGELSGPRLLVSSPIFTAPGGHPASGICSGEPWCAGKLSLEAGSAEQARAAVRRFARGGVQAIKLVYDSFDKTALGGPDLNFPRLDEDIMAAIIAEARLVDLPVVAHSKTVDETAVVAGAGVDALVHSALLENDGFTTSGGEYLPGLIAEQELSVTTTIRSFYERLESAPIEARTQPRRNFSLVGPSLRAYSDAGVTLMFGTDFDGAGLDPDPADAVRSEARALVAAGFSELEVIAMATGNASQHPMIPRGLGTLKVGNIADLLILADQPLEDITAITRPLIVIKAGRIVVDERSSGVKE